MGKEDYTDFLQRYRRIFAGFTRTEYVPLIATEAFNSFVKDPTGRTYIDFASSGAVMNVGYSNPKIVEAIRRQSEKLLHFTHIYGFNEPALLLAEKLAEIAPVEEPRVALGLSGSDANEGALLASRAYRRGRSILLSYQNSFHGCTLASATASGVELSRETLRITGGWSIDVIHLPYPDCYRCPLGLSPRSCRRQCVELVKEVVDERGDNVFAYIAEPIQGDGGIVIPPREYFSEVEAYLRRKDIPLIMDEVQTGVGRTGWWFASQYYGVKPDIVTLGKALGGGLPLSAIIGRSDIMESLPRFSYSFTLSGNPLASAAALATLEYIEENRLLERARRLGEKAIDELRRMARRHSIVGDVRGLGLMIGVDLVKDKDSKARAYSEAKKVVWRAYELGLIVFYVAGNVLRIQPPLTIEDEVLEEGLKLLDQAIEDVENGKVSDNVVKMVEGW